MSDVGRILAGWREMGRSSAGAVEGSARGIPGGRGKVRALWQQGDFVSVFETVLGSAMRSQQCPGRGASYAANVRGVFTAQQWPLLQNLGALTCDTPHLANGGTTPPGG
jgi:hypothetical protein